MNIPTTPHERKYIIEKIDNRLESRCIVGFEVQRYENVRLGHENMGVFAYNRMVITNYSHLPITPYYAHEFPHFRHNASPSLGVPQSRIVETHLRYGTTKSLSYYIRTRKLKNSKI